MIFSSPRPKNLNSIVKTKKTRNTITNPTIAAVIVPLALSTAALSPPENIHFIAPMSKKNSATITAITKINVIAAPKMPGILVSSKQRMSNGGCGHPIKPWAEAEEARNKYIKSAVVGANNFFIKFIIHIIFFLCQEGSLL